MRSTYQAKCERCKVYPAAPGDTPLCPKCLRERAATRAELEHEAAEHARKRQASPPKAEVPYCGACLTTLFVRDVNGTTGVGLCLTCKVKHQGRHVPSLASSYGTPRSPIAERDPNGVY